MDKDLLKRYLRGECTAAEKQQVEQWLQADDDLPYAPQADRLVQSQHWQLLEARIRTKPERTQTGSRKLTFVGSAAALVLVAFGFWLFLLRPVGSEVEWVYLHTSPGKRQALTLADSTVIYLAGNSELAYPRRFSDTFREVRFLKGEVYFDIHSDHQRPFIVHTAADEQIRVLGTAFNVRRISEDHPLEVTLVHGRIAYRTLMEEQLLVLGEQLISDGGATRKRRLSDTGTVTAWTTGMLWFEETPIQAVFDRIEQHYGVTFSGTEAVAHQVITAKFRNEPLDRVLQVISRSTNLTFTRDGRNVRIKQHE